MTLREMIIRTGANACEHENPAAARNILDELISFSSIWADVLDRNLEDVDIKPAPHL